MLAPPVPGAARGAGAAAAPGTAHRSLHFQACRQLQAESVADKHALAASALSAGSNRFAGGSAAHLLERRSSPSAMLRTPVAAADGRPAGGSGHRPAGSPAQQGWQQERRHWAAANAVQPAAANSPALQYAPRFMPQQPQWREPVKQPLGVPPPVQQPPAQPLPAVSPPPPPPPAQWQGVEVAGVVQRVTYRAQETGFCVLKLQLEAGYSAPPAARSGQGSGGRGRGRGRTDESLVTVTGIFPRETVNKGQRLRFTGRWVHHNTYGQQLHADRLEDLEPHGSRSLIAYLGGGAIPGVGPVTARRMVAGLGDSVLEILDRPDAEAMLQQCDGIGAVMAAKIRSGWAAGRGTRASEKFLHDMGLTMAQAHQVVRQLGEDAEQLVREDPYRAMRKGSISFRLADSLAAQLGVSPGLPSRGAAAISAELQSVARRSGHCYLPWGQLRSAAHTMLLQTGRPWPEDASLEDVARGMVARGRMVAEPPSEAPLLRQEWTTMAPAYAGHAAATAGDPDLELGPEAVLRQHLVDHVMGVGPAAAKRLFAQFGDAQRLTAVFDSSTAVTQLCRCPGFKQLTAKRAKTSWNAKRGLLDESMAAAAAGKNIAAKAAAAPAPAADEDLNPWEDGTRCYSPDMYRAESAVASVLTRLAAQPRQPIPAWRHPSGDARVEAWMNSVEKETKVQLSEGQRKAIREAANAPVMVLTGGPGCGKTFATATIVKLWRAMGRGSSQVALCAPTGRAAERLAHTARYSASTIHRLLKVQGRSSNGNSEDEATTSSGGGGGDSTEVLPPKFEFHAGNRLKCTKLLVDEASMLDLPLAAALMDALPSKPDFQLVLVGDAEQLPPVGPGSVLRAIMEAGVVPVVDLRKIFRQAEASTIVTTAHQINAGIVPSMDPITTSQLQDLASESGSAHWVQVDDRGGAAAVEAAAIDAVKQLQASGMDVAKDLQVLSPMKKGPAGTRSLNTALQALLNPPTPGKAQMQRRGTDPSAVFRIGDRVIQVVNDYERDVFNGDQGFVVGVLPDGALEVEFPAALPSIAGGADSAAKPLPANPADAPGAALAWVAPAYRPAGGGAGQGAEASLRSGPMPVTHGGAPPRRVQYLGRQMDALELAWVTTVHKAQGGESHAVLMCLAPSHRPLLSRRLFYTGLTRARELAVLVATQGALQTAVREAPGGARACCLKDRFRLGALAAGAEEQQPQRF